MKRGAVAFQATREMSAAALGVDLDVLGSSDAGAGLAARRTATRDIADTAARAVVIALFTVMAVRLGLDYMQTGRLTGLLLLASEALVGRRRIAEEFQSGADAFDARAGAAKAPETRRRTSRAVGARPAFADVAAEQPRQLRHG